MLKPARDRLMVEVTEQELRLTESIELSQRSQHGIRIQQGLVVMVGDSLKGKFEAGELVLFSMETPRNRIGDKVYVFPRVGSVIARGKDVGD